MQPFTTFKSVAAPLPIAKIDTGVIVPGRFMRLRRRPGQADYAHVFLHDLRFLDNGAPRVDFVLNEAAYQGAGILVTGPDFGCGSSREGAAYAVLDFGVRALIGPSFGDVFVGNCMQNGIVTVVLPLPEIKAMWQQLQQKPGSQIEVNLVHQKVLGPDGRVYPFEFDQTRKQRLLQGLDDIGVTLTHLDRIESFEAQYRLKKRWIQART
ncbi:MAG: 3-isopropylmalate dehydratase small subunit [Betaproteobacteria bacterium]